MHPIRQRLWNVRQRTALGDTPASCCGAELQSLSHQLLPLCTTGLAEDNDPHATSSVDLASRLRAMPRMFKSS